MLLPDEPRLLMERVGNRTDCYLSMPMLGVAFLVASDKDAPKASALPKPKQHSHLSIVAPAEQEQVSA